MTIVPRLVEVVRDPVPRGAWVEPVAAPESGAIQLAEAVYRHPVSQVSNDGAGGRETDGSLVVVVPTLGVCVPHAAVEGLPLSGGGHLVVPVLVVVEETPRGGDTFQRP